MTPDDPDDPDYIKCDYCSKQATHYRRQIKMGEFHYCLDHAPCNATRLDSTPADPQDTQP